MSTALWYSVLDRQKILNRFPALIVMAKMMVRMITEKGGRMRRLKIYGDNKNINDDVSEDLKLQAGRRCLE